MRDGEECCAVSPPRKVSREEESLLLQPLGGLASKFTELDNALIREIFSAIAVPRRATVAVFNGALVQAG